MPAIRPSLILTDLFSRKIDNAAIFVERLTAFATQFASLRVQ